MPAQIAIRVATADDVRELVRLNKVAQAVHVAIAPKIYRDDVGDDEISDFWSDRLNDEQGIIALAVVDEREVAGSILFERQLKGLNVFAKAREVIYIHQLAVAPEWRRLGVASQLMAFAERTAASCGINEIQLSVWTANIAAQRLYSTLDYTEGAVTRSKLLAPG